ncbi:MAG: OmpH family outer membrane protein [Bacteroidia bacterium]
MKKLVYLISAATLMLACNSKSGNEKSSEEKPKVKAVLPDSASGLNIVFFENDSLITQYTYSKELDEQIRRKERGILSGREQDMASFQEMYKSAVEKAPMMTTNERQQIEQQLAQKEQELMAKDQTTEQSYIKWKTDILINFQAHLDSLLENFRTEHGYDVIVPSGGGITKFYYSKNLDVTDTLINYLNVRYKPKTEKK